MFLLVGTKALRVLKSLQIHGVILGGWAKLHELAEELVDGITASSWVDVFLFVSQTKRRAFFYGQEGNVKKTMCFLWMLFVRNSRKTGEHWWWLARTCCSTGIRFRTLKVIVWTQNTEMFTLHVWVALAGQEWLLLKVLLSIWSHQFAPTKVLVVWDPFDLLVQV